ncbi:MAG: hypothetical protein ACJ75S_06990 [Solirubrobacterales bacterium]
MIKARATDDKGEPIIILGLESGNIGRLKKGDPIMFDMAELGLKGTCIITYGETQADCAVAIEKMGFRLGKGRG